MVFGFYYTDVSPNGLFNEDPVAPANRFFRTIDLSRVEVPGIHMHIHEAHMVSPTDAVARFFR